MILVRRGHRHAGDHLIASKTAIFVLFLGLAE